MQPDFWHERWQRDQIGFHQDQVNSHLLNFWQEFNIAQGGRIFVPLCGKSRDMSWLRAVGHEVVGVEISAIAARAYFAENGLDFSVVSRDGFDVYEGDGIHIFCGDFFAMTATHLAGVKAVYDRAALIALPPEMRPAYARHMESLLAPGTRTLLVSFEYPQHEMEGPPFSVEEPEVRALYRNACTVTLLHDMDILDREPRFRERGVSRLREKVYALAYNPTFTP